MRGWSRLGYFSSLSASICPAYAGMIPRTSCSSPFSSHLSRVCGDDPNLLTPLEKESIFVPRMRGWSHLQKRPCGEKRICPAYAGMIPRTMKDTFFNPHLSRVCGDDPKIADYIKVGDKFVPRMRGWSPCCSRLSTITGICPAYAGMIPVVYRNGGLCRNLSRVCGDDPGLGTTGKEIAKFVPRMRGWSYFRPSSRPSVAICPAYAGMILYKPKLTDEDCNLSRVCGDDPMRGIFMWLVRGFVPRMRGWSYMRVQLTYSPVICPAYAGMILVSQGFVIVYVDLSRVCGDDPQEAIDYIVSK